MILYPNFMGVLRHVGHHNAIRQLALPRVLFLSFLIENRPYEGAQEFIQLSRVSPTSPPIVPFILATSLTYRAQGDYSFRSKKDWMNHQNMLSGSRHLSVVCSSGHMISLQNLYPAF